MKINSQKSIKSLESEKKEQNIKPKSKTESQSGKIEKIGKEKDHNKKIIPQDELKEKETHPKSHIPKLRSQKSKVLNKQEEKRIQNISSAIIDAGISDNFSSLFGSLTISVSCIVLVFCLRFS